MDIVLAQSMTTQTNIVTLYFRKLRVRIVVDNTDLMSLTLRTFAEIVVDYADTVSA